jgi:glycosyltransferase involved in cell wall biosynthesis
MPTSSVFKEIKHKWAWRGMRVSIIIRAYNEEAHIARLLLGINAQTQQPYEVIVVDSGSTDDTIVIAKRFGAKVVHISKDEFTFGRALNRGCAEASGDIFVFPSAHVFPVFDTWLETLIAPFRDERVILAYGRQIPGDRNKFSERQIFAHWFPAHSVCPQKTYFCNNANCAIRASAWRNLPYDETLTGLEDLAWAKIAQARGGWIAYVADAEIVHVHDESWEQVQNRYRREAIAMHNIDPRIRFTRLDFITLLARNILSDFRAALHEHRFFFEAASILKFRYSQLLGTYIGYHGSTEMSAHLRQRFFYPTQLHERRAGERSHKAHRIDYAVLEASQFKHYDPASDPSFDRKTAPGNQSKSSVVRVVNFDRE